MVCIKKSRVHKRHFNQVSCCFRERVWNVRLRQKKRGRSFPSAINSQAEITSRNVKGLERKRKTKKKKKLHCIILLSYISDTGVKSAHKPKEVKITLTAPLASGTLWRQQLHAGSAPEETEPGLCCSSGTSHPCPPWLVEKLVALLVQSLTWALHNQAL